MLSLLKNDILENHVYFTHFSNLKSFLCYLMIQITVIRNICLCFKCHLQFFQNLVSDIQIFDVRKHRVSFLNIDALTDPIWLMITVFRKIWNIRYNQKSIFISVNFFEHLVFLWILTSGYFRNAQCIFRYCSASLNRHLFSGALSSLAYKITGFLYNIKKVESCGSYKISLCQTGIH